VREVPRRRANDRALGTLFIGIGVAGSMITYILAADGHVVVHLGALLAVVYGAFHLVAPRR
jgi:hypothetical protein